MSKDSIEHPQEEDNDSFHKVKDNEVSCEMQVDGDNEVDLIENIDWDELEIAQDNNVDIITKNGNTTVFSTHISEML